MLPRSRRMEKTLYAAGGDVGISGEIRAWNVPDGKPLRTITGHSDAIYALALSPDGKTLATGSYDQKNKTLVHRFRR